MNATLPPMPLSISGKTTIGKRVALASVLVSATLAVAKIVIGLLGRSTAVVADGIESAGDVVASGIVLFGFAIAARPADENHPYGHGKYETLTGLVVGIILFLGGHRDLLSIACKCGPNARPTSSVRVVATFAVDDLQGDTIGFEVSIWPVDWEFSTYRRCLERFR